MTPEDKEKIIRSLCDAVRDETIARIKHMPETWDGIELREYLARMFDRECILSRSSHLTEQSRRETKRRLREFRNEVAVRYGL